MTARRTPPAGLQRRTVVQALATAPVALSFPAVVRAQAAPVRIGYAIARTGPWAAGGQVSQEPNYLLWAEQQNAAGGMNVKGSKRPIELISSDDRSDIETCVRSYEKLMGSDKVDLVLPPWGSNANFAVAPLANRYGYPFIAPTALSPAADRDEAALLLPDAAAAQADDGSVGRHAQGQRRQVDGGDLRRRPVRSGKLRRAEGGGTGQRHQHRRGQELPAGGEGPVAGASFDEGQEPRRLRRPDLPAGHHPRQQAGQGDRLQPEVLLRIGRHCVPALPQRDGRRVPRACSAWVPGTARRAPVPRPTSTPT